MTVLRLFVEMDGDMHAEVLPVLIYQQCFTSRHLEFNSLEAEGTPVVRISKEGASAYGGDIVKDMNQEDS